MTWLKGSTTYANLAGDLTRLICGEVADGSSNTNAVGDRWVREFTRTVTDLVLNGTTTITSATAAFTDADRGAHIYGVNIPTNSVIQSVTNSTTVVMTVAATGSGTGVTGQICHDTIRTKSSLDVSTGNISNRTGYFAALGTGVGLSSTATGLNSVCRVTSPFTSDPSTSGFHRWIVFINIGSANSVINNYSTATATYDIYDADSGATIASNSGITIGSGGVITVANGLQVTISDPSGFITASTRFVRAFTSTYMRGIDWWPMLYRQGATAPSFSVAPPGVAGTDYDILTQVNNPTAVQVRMLERGNLFHGLGIKTATGLGSNDLYTVSWSMALIKCRIFNNPTTNGVLSLDVGQAKVDTVNTTYLIRCSGGFRITTWCKFAQTPGSVSNSTTVQYWISVKSDGIALILNMDPGATGKMGNAWIGTFTPTDPTYDVFPVSFNSHAEDFTANNSTDLSSFMLTLQYGYFALRQRQNGSEGSRDWQTKWMRCEAYHSAVTNSNNALHPGTTSADITSSNISPSLNTGQAPMLQMMGQYTSATTAIPTAIPPRQAKPAIDGKWWLYGAKLIDGGNYSQNTAVANENIWVRGSLSRWYFIPGDSWSSGDELTDTVSGTVYFLAMPDYIGFGIRVQVTTNTYQGGIALAEV